MKRISVTTSSRGYDVLLGQGLLSEAGALLRSKLNLQNETVVVVSSAPVWKHWGDSLSRSFATGGLRWHKLIIEDGETAKTITTVARAADELVALGADRSSVIVAFGGGVVGDMAGFLAAIYMRGVRIVQLPTTLLAQVDASIGGKTGVNLSCGKNLLGSFHQPECVIVDPALTSTLTDREFRAGLFEVVKTGIIADPALFDLVESQPDRILAREIGTIESCVESSVRVKAEVVSEDERESGRRRILNYGHTLGHALEAETHYSHFLHGEAVAWGMIAAAHLAFTTKHCGAETLKRISHIVLRYGPLPPVTSDTNSIVRRTASDKKTIGGRTHWILAPEIGTTTVTADIPVEAVMAAVEHIKALSTTR